MAGAAVVEALIEGLLEGDVEAADDAGGKGGGVGVPGPVVDVPFPGEWIEHPSPDAVAVGVEAVEGAVVHGDEGEAGGGREGLLGGAPGDVDEVRVHGDVGAGHAGDGVDGVEEVVVAGDFADLAEGVDDAGGGFVVDEGDGAEAGARLDELSHVVRIDGAAGGDVEGDDLAAVRLEDLGDAVRERAGLHDERLQGRQAAHGHLGAGGAGTGDHDDGAVGAEGLLETVDDAMVDFEVLVAVVGHDGLGHLGERFGSGVGGSGDHEHGRGPFTRRLFRASGNSLTANVRAGQNNSGCADWALLGSDAGGEWHAGDARATAGPDIAGVGGQ